MLKTVNSDCGIDAHCSPTMQYNVQRKWRSSSHLEKLLNKLLLMLKQLQKRFEKKKMIKYINVETVLN